MPANKELLVSLQRLAKHLEKIPVGTSAAVPQKRDDDTIPPELLEKLEKPEEEPKSTEGFT